MAGIAHKPYTMWHVLQCQTTLECVKFNRNGRLLATGDRNGRLTIWDTELGLELIWDEPINTLPIYDLVWSRDSFSIFLGKDLGMYTVWDVARCKTLRTASVGADYITSVDLDSRGNLGLIGGKKNIGLLDMRIPQIIHSRRAHNCTETGFLTASRFSRDETKVLSSGLDADFKVWDKGSFMPINLPYPDTQVKRSVYFPRGREILATYTNGTYEVLDAETLASIAYGGGISDYRYSFKNAAVDADSSLLIAGNDGCVTVMCETGVVQKLRHDRIVDIVECSEENPVAACVPVGEKRVFLWNYPIS